MKYNGRSFRNKELAAAVTFASARSTGHGAPNVWRSEPGGNQKQERQRKTDSKKEEETQGQVAEENAWKENGISNREVPTTFICAADRRHQMAFFTLLCRFRCH